MTDNKLTQELLQHLFDYRDDGVLIWKNVNTNTVKIGDIAGSIRDNYYSIGINKKIYLTHRLIFLYHHGYLPTYIDHINTDKLDNRITNLRSVTMGQNAMNRKKQKNKTSIYKGVSFDKPTQKWMAQITVNYKNKSLGRFDNEKDAAIAYNEAAKDIFMEYANLNIIEVI